MKKGFKFSPSACSCRNSWKNNIKCRISFQPYCWFISALATQIEQIWNVFFMYVRVRSSLEQKSFDQMLGGASLSVHLEFVFNSFSFFLSLNLNLISSKEKEMGKMVAARFAKLWRHQSSLKPLQPHSQSSEHLFPSFMVNAKKASLLRIYLLIHLDLRLKLLRP